MPLPATAKQPIVEEHRVHERDSGSSPVQVALLTASINHLTQHLKDHPHDNSSRRGLLKMVGRRRRLLAYISRHNPEEYQALVAKLGLRR